MKAFIWACYTAIAAILIVGTAISSSIIWTFQAMEEGKAREAAAVAGSEAKEAAEVPQSVRDLVRSMVTFDGDLFWENRDVLTKANATNQAERSGVEDEPELNDDGSPKKNTDGTTVVKTPAGLIMARRYMEQQKALDQTVTARYYTKYSNLGGATRPDGVYQQGQTLWTYIYVIDFTSNKTGDKLTVYYAITTNPLDGDRTSRIE